VTEASKPMALAMSGLETMLATQLTEKTVSDRTATFAFTGNDRQGNAVNTFLCRLDNANFSACTSPVTYRDLSDGQHLFQVLVSDANGNVDITPAGYTWSIGNVQPSRALKQYLPLVARNAIQSIQSTAEGNPPTETVETAGATPVAAVSEAVEVVEVTVENNVGIGEAVNETGNVHLLYLPLAQQ
jgi:hypothetical protein